MCWRKEHIEERRKTEITEEKIGLTGQRSSNGRRIETVEMKKKDGGDRDTRERKRRSRRQNLG